MSTEVQQPGAHPGRRTNHVTIAVRFGVCPPLTHMSALSHMRLGPLRIRAQCLLMSGRADLLHALLTSQ